VKFAVVGAGAIGAYVGAALARSGQDVVLIARGAHLEAMQKRGVQVVSPLGDFTVDAPATDDIDAVSDADVVFVALKAYSLTELAPRLGRSLKPGSATVWAQNGIPWWYFESHAGPLEGTVLSSVDPGGVIRDTIDPESVVGCVVYCSAELSAPGVVKHLEGNRFILGEPDGSATERCQQISDALVAAGLKAPVDHQLRNQIWLKLVGNSAFNPITAITGATLGELGLLDEMVATLRAIFSECASVAEKLGATFPISLERRLQAGIAVGAHKTSMLQDREAGKPLELDCMTGAVIELADLVGVDVPHMRTVYACAKLLDALKR
jgi:2-dehydropantoate 2-reductase